MGREAWMLIGVAGAAAVATALLMTRGARVATPRRREEDLVDEAGRESFPASDPPSWTLGEDRD